ncbi:MAG: Ig-like domain-containing protein, partial [Thermoplasmata archaeon]|nr:Ig-like domain-containing protein [Thermoplasmata archaeon]
KNISADCSELAQGIKYYVNLTGKNFMDAGLTPMEGDMEFNFTTIDANPWVDSSIPADMAFDVSVAAGTMEIVFSEEMDPAYGNVATPKSYTAIPFTSGWTWSEVNTKISARYDTLVPSTDYDLEVQNDRDLNGNVVFGGTWILFSTVAGPGVVSTTPADGAIEQDTATGTYIIQFNEAMDPTKGTVTTGLPIAGGWNWFLGNTELHGVYTELVGATKYTVDLNGGGFENLARTPLMGDMEFNFTTKSPPEVTLTIPADGAPDISIISSIYIIQFSEPMDEGTVITLDTDLPLSGGGWWASSTEYRHSYNTLADSTTYYVDVSSAGFLDPEANGLIGDTYFDFNTVAI